MFKILDENTDGAISRTEFVSVFKRLYLNYKELKEILDDTDFGNPLSVREKNLDLEQRSTEWCERSTTGEGEKCQPGGQSVWPGGC